MILSAALAAGAGCALGDGELPPAREGRSGLQGTGTLAGRQVAVANGLPELVVGDCDPLDGDDDDLCVITDTIDGRTFVLTVENPRVVVTGAELEVGDAGCGSPGACDAVDALAVVSIKLETEPPVLASGGSLRLTRVEPFANYVGSINLTLPSGSFSGTFDIVPRPE